MLHWQRPQHHVEQFNDSMNSGYYQVNPLCMPLQTGHAASLCTHCLSCMLLLL